jgi:dienelactone hydrolase
MACPACVSGTLHAGTPSGTITTLHGLPTYIASPSGPPKGTIIILPDAFGWSFNNSRILADAYASKGAFRVLLPDIMGGAVLSTELLTCMDTILDDSASILWKIWYALKAMVLFLPWKLRCRDSITHPRALAFAHALRADPAYAGPLGAAGFCWGGKHVFLLARDSATASDGRPLLDAAFTAHPSFLSIPADAAAVCVPMGVAAAEKDHQLPKAKREEMEAALRAGPAEYEVRVYEGATHGFAVRANPKVERENGQGVEAEEQAVAWFTRFFEGR